MRQITTAARLACALSLSLLSSLVLLPAGALAQAYPNKPIRILVHIPPGGAPDIAARVVGEKLGEALGQPVVIDNRPGANGNIAGEIVAKSPPDGYTLLACVDSQVVINPHVYRSMPFDPMKDLVPVATLASNEFFLAANPEQPFKTFREFIDYARKSQPPLNYASGGNGSQQQLTMEMLKTRAGIPLAHIPYKGSGPATVALLAGEVPVEFAGSNAKAAGVEVFHRLHDLLAAVHHEGALADDGLVNRLAAEQQQGGVAVGFNLQASPARSSSAICASRTTSLPLTSTVPCSTTTAAVRPSGTVSEAVLPCFSRMSHTSIGVKVCAGPRVALVVAGNHAH
jgi:hypothetical protein